MKEFLLSEDFGYALIIAMGAVMFIGISYLLFINSRFDKDK